MTVPDLRSTVELRTQLFLGARGQCKCVNVHGLKNTELQTLYYYSWTIVANLDL